MPIEVMFRPETHTYVSPAGKILPGITSTLRLAGLMYEVDGNGWIDKEKGSRIHEAIHFDCEGDLDESTVDPADMVYVESARLAVRELGIRILKAEWAITDAAEAYGYATKVDAFALWQGKPAVINWKSSIKVYRFEAIQSALEALLFSPESVERLYIHLSGDKPGYRLERLQDRSDFNIAKCAIGTSAWVRADRKRGTT